MSSSATSWKVPRAEERKGARPALKASPGARPFPAELRGS